MRFHLTSKDVGRVRIASVTNGADRGVGHWGRLSLDAEVEGRRLAALMAAGGVERLLNAIHPAIRWDPPFLHIPVGHERDERPLGGGGLIVLPSRHCRTPAVLVDPGRPAILICPIAAPRSEGEGSEERRSLGGLIGRTRATILEAIAEEECNTSRLAARAMCSLPAASQHAAALRAGGLISSRQHGRSVIHSVTELGLLLLGRHRAVIPSGPSGAGGFGRSGTMGH